ncbi:hypothetical protein B0A48_14180 [Cryoendolithus antarcticus]|uniref:SnoaL-like domain-containing protein n=1 Tax=Cryoendolithus antarcticus TaxID=1507870 RepID=A0A1V8SLD8_9PEZI|nr:hypothetical protein B0A48_14180 [Cryoendolithus antarcticus]
MYNLIVARISKKNFEAVNNKDFDSILKQCDAKIHHRFGGNHALGGERHSREVLSRWFQRLGRLSPELKLTVKDIWVKGWPNDTTVIMRWTATDRDNPDGSPYRNHGVHIIRMKWFKVVDIDANEDSEAVAQSMKIKVDAGWEEAGLPPLTS